VSTTGIEPDYDTAAEAWMVLEMTIEAMRHNNRVIEITREFQTRLDTERNA
jgi:hypothetical protein